MHRPRRDSKVSFTDLAETPCMMGAADLALIDQTLAKLPPDARLIEVGPWLGGVSQKLAAFGELHVVDRFIWSDLNAEKYPDLMAPGDSFRPAFEHLLRQAGHDAKVHESDFEDFTWQGGALDFCLIDAPRTCDDLWLCLDKLLSQLKPDGFLLVKHGLNPAHFDMLALVEALVAKDILVLPETGQPHWCNIALLQPGPRFHDLPTAISALDLIADVSPQPAPPQDLEERRLLLMVARLAYLAAKGQIPLAFQVLRSHAADRRILAAWTALEPKVVVSKEQEGAFAAFSDLLEHHHSTETKTLWAPASQSLSWAMRHCWRTYLTRSDLVEFRVEAIAKNFASGKFATITQSEAEVPYDLFG